MKRMMWLVILALLMTAFSYADEFRGMIKPVNVANDNDTRNGVANTGIYGYSVLYRGPYSGTDTFRFTPGTGRHGGVDIRCLSGTPVFAPCDAYLDFSFRYNLSTDSSNGGWGGTNLGITCLDVISRLARMKLEIKKNQPT